MTVLVSGCIINYKDKYLLLQRSTGKTQSGKWGFPGGKQDEGESAKQAAIRETHEETGYMIPDDEIKQVDFVHHEFDETDKVDYTVYWHEADQMFVPEISPNEHSAYSWMSLEDIKTNDDIIDTLEEILERAILSNKGGDMSDSCEDCCGSAKDKTNSEGEE